MGYRASFRLAENSPAPSGFHWAEGLWEKEIESEEDMPKLIAQGVEQGLRLYEARLLKPTLKEIYAAWLEGGRRKVTELHGTADDSPEDGAFWEGAEKLQEGGEETFSEDANTGEEAPETPEEA